MSLENGLTNNVLDTARHRNYKGMMKLSSRSVYLLTLTVIAILTCVTTIIFYMGGDKQLAKESMGGGATIGMIAFFFMPIMLDNYNN